MRTLLAASLVSAFLFSNTSNAQSGTEFWFAPPEVTYSHNSPGGVPIYLNISSFGQAATVTIDQPANAGFTPIVINLAANSSHQEDLSAFVASLETEPTNTILNTGLRITATDTITAYYEVSNTNNTDIFSLKGKNSLGTEFYIPLHNHSAFYNHTFASPHEAYASFDIVATQNNTQVLIYSPTQVDGHAALTPFTITLNQGQTYSCGWTGTNYTSPSTHPSGAVVVSDKPVAITIKDDSDHNPSGGCYDLFGDQIVPVNIVGTEYIAVKGQLNNTGDESVFITATLNNTKVYIDGSGTPLTTLFAGQTYRYDMDYLASSTDNSVYIETSKPAYVTHVTGFGCEGGQALLPPLGCAGSEQVSFTRSTSESFFLNILVRATAVNDFTITGAGTATINPADFQAVPGTGGVWMAARIQYNTTEIPVNSAHLITNSSDVFSLAIINGGAGTGCRYGFFSEFAAEVITDAGSDVIVCANDTAQLAGSVTGGTTTGEWTTNGSGQFLPTSTSLNARYVPSANDISAGSVVLTLTSTGNCFPVSDNLTLNITPAPTVDAGADVSVCANNADVNLSGAVTIAAGGIWSGGTGTFNPNNTTLTTTYTPTPAEISSGSLILTLTTTGNGSCNAESDNINLTFTPAPIVDAGANISVCSNNPDAVLSGAVTTATGGIWSGGTGTFSPNINALGATYTPTASEVSSGTMVLTLTTTGNGNCLAESDNVTITYTPSPTVSAGSDQTLCENNPNASLSGSVTLATGGQWSGGLGTFVPNNNSLNVTYSPAASEIASGSVTLTLTTTGNGNCNPESDDVVLTFTGAPTVNAGTDQTVCASSPQVTLNGSVSIATGGQWSGGTGSYSPNANTLNATYTPSAAEISAGTVTLTLTTTGNGNCTPVTDNVTITIDASPTANAGPNLTSCENNPAVNLAGVVTSATGGQWSGGGGNYNASNTDLNAVYTPSAAEISAGNVTLTLTTTGAGTCPATSDNVLITIIPSPTANAGADQTICANNANISLNGSVSGASGGQWSGGLGTFNPSNTALNAVYSPTATEIASGSVTLTLTTTGNGTCNPETDNMTITFTTAPTVDAGSNITTCANNAVATLNGSFSVSSGAIWSGGSGSFAPSATDPSATYTPSSAEITAGMVTLTLTSTGNGNCLAVSDNVDITINPSPSVNAGGDQTVCVNNLNVSLSGSVSGVTNTGSWTTLGSGTFSPNNTTLNATYVASSADSLSGSVTLVLTSTNNGSCLPVTDTMLITILPAGTANAGSDVTVCANNATVSLNGAIGGSATQGTWATNGTGVFSPNNTTLNATYIPSPADKANGNVTLTLTVNSCNNASDNMVITITPEPAVNAGPDQTICATNLTVNLSGIVTGPTTSGVWTTLGSGTFANPNNTTTTYQCSSADSTAQSVTLILEATGIGNCLPASDTLVIYIYQTGTVNAGNDITLCANNGVVSLNGSVGGGASAGQWTTSGSGTFLPDDTSLNATYHPSIADTINGTVNLILSATNSCNSASDFITVTYTPAPVTNAGPDQFICGTNPFVGLSGSFQGSTGAVWSTSGTGTFSPSTVVTSPTYQASASDIANGGVTIYYTSIGNGSCNPVVDSMIITISSGIVVNAGPDQTVCSTAGFTVMLGSVTNGSTSGVWTTLGTGTFQPNDSLLNAEYHFSNADTTIGSVQLILTSTNNGTCLAESDTVTITFGASAYAYAGADQTICASSTIVPLSAAISGGATQGQWQTLGSGTFSPNNTSLNAVYQPSPTDSINGSVQLVISTTDHGTCLVGRDTMTVTIEPIPVVNAGTDIQICSTIDSIPLSGSVVNAPGGIWSTTGTGSFSPNSTNLTASYFPSPADIAAGSVTLFLTSAGSAICGPVSDSVKITLVNPMFVQFGTSPTCVGELTSFVDNTIVYAGSISGWNWNFGDGDSSQAQSPLHIYSTSGTYNVSLTVESSLGCSKTLIKTIVVNPNPTAAASFTPNTPNIGDPVQFTNLSLNTTAWSWYFGDGSGVSTSENPSYTYSIPGVYTIIFTAQNTFGCQDTVQMVISVLDQSIYPPVVPTGFSPNNDGDNDILYVRGGPFESVSLSVYNNWGNLIFQSDDVTVGWDGTWKGKDQPPGDYIYTVKAKLVDGTEYDKSGSVSIIR